MIRLLNAEQTLTFEVTEAAERRWAQAMDEKSVYNEEMTQNCTPGFYNNEGDLKRQKPLFADVYGAGPIEFVELLSHWRRYDMRSDLDPGDEGRDYDVGWSLGRPTTQGSERNDIRRSDNLDGGEMAVAADLPGRRRAVGRRKP